MKNIYSRNLKKMKTMQENNPLYVWAKNECYLDLEDMKKEAEADGLYKYYEGCVLSALAAFKSLCDDGHSDQSIQVTKGILNRLIDGKPLSLIKEDEATWGTAKDGMSAQNTRMSSLFCRFDKDGNKTYSDVDRVTLRDGRGSWHSGYLTEYIDRLHPITFPYSGNEKWVLIGETSKSESCPDNSDYDTTTVTKIEHYVDGRLVSSEDVNLVWKEDQEYHKMILQG